MSHSLLESLTTEDWSALRVVAKQIETYERSLSNQSADTVEADGTIVLGGTEMAAPLQTLMTYFYEKDLVVVFDWAHWEEGRAIFASSAKDKFDNLNAEDTLKLFTAILRNDRFSDGAWGELFQSGDGIKLLQHLLRFEPHTR